MSRTILLATVLLGMASVGSLAGAQETADPALATPAATDPAAAPVATDPAAAPVGGAIDETVSNVAERADEVIEQAQRKVGEVAQQVDQSEQANLVRSGILRPIYTLAERFSFPAFHWLVFAVMVTGVVSFALQLTLGKLIVLSRMSLSPSEVLSDTLGLIVSLVGLVLTTQAATQNSNFTSSAFAVISATVVGALAGLVFYVWGQRQELQAVEGRKRANVPTSSSNNPPTTKN